MKCKKCNNELNVTDLYCEKCGNETRTLKKLKIFLYLSIILFIIILGYYFLYYVLGYNFHSNKYNLLASLIPILYIIGVYGAINSYLYNYKKRIALAILILYGSAFLYATIKIIYYIISCKFIGS